MALINCPECDKQVSDRAQTCPNCGVGIASARRTHAAGAPLTTIQETSKKLKLQQLISGLLFAVGFVWAVSLGEQASALPVLMALVGLIWFLVTRFRVWWHHK